MATILFSNNGASTLAGAIGPTATSASLASGTGSLFPSPGADEYFVMTFEDAATGLENEIVHVTSRTGDVITIVRGQEGTNPQSWAAGDLANNLNTAGTMEAMLQAEQEHPARTITASGAFAMTSADGAICLARVSALATSSTELPTDAVDGQVFYIEDGASNFHDYPVTVAAPAGKTISGQASVVLNTNRGSWSFRFYSDSNIFTVGSAR